MMIPTVHRNGTSREALVEQMRGAADAVDQAIQALQETTPNRRDYYPQGEQALELACEEYRQRLLAVRQVHADLMLLWQGIVDQIPG